METTLASCLNLPDHFTPRLRGNLLVVLFVVLLAGSIPAPAGEPAAIRACRRSRRVYPRACGGTEQGRTVAAPAQGLSPRLRGNPTLARDRKAANGSIPAPAGEPVRGRGPAVRREVYPRACGGTHRKPKPSAPLPGLSPRLRGNHQQQRFVAAQAGSIPAPAGEPLVAVAIRRGSRVYPRACGGTLTR